MKLQEINSKIVMLDHATSLGGAEKSLLLLANNIDKENTKIYIGCKQGQLQESASKSNINTITFDFLRFRRSFSSFPAWINSVRAIANFATNNNINIIHSNTIRSTIYGVLAAKRGRLPFLWHMRDFWLSESEPKNKIFDSFGKWLIGSAATHIITNSHAVAEKLPFPNKTTVVHNGVDLKQFNPSNRPAPIHLPSVSTSTPIIGMVGRLRPWKGQDRFLRTAALIAEQDTEVHFLIVGGSPFGVDDGYAESLHSLAADLGIADQVTFTGQLDDVRPALAAMDIFVHPGDPEPFGLVNIEAMAMNKPVVAFAHGALPEIVIDGLTGLLVPPGDEAQLAKAVIDLIDQPDRAKQMGKAGRARVEQHFTAKRMAREVEAVWEKVLE